MVLAHFTEPADRRQKRGEIDPPETRTAPCGPVPTAGLARLIRFGQEAIVLFDQFGNRLLGRGEAVDNELDAGITMILRETVGTRPVPWTLSATRDSAWAVPPADLVGLR